MRLWLERLAARPHASFKRFLLGLLLFVIGLFALLFGPVWPEVIYGALAVMAIGALIAAGGYVGILANRIVRFWLD